MKAESIIKRAVTEMGTRILSLARIGFGQYISIKAKAMVATIA